MKGKAGWRRAKLSRMLQTLNQGSEESHRLATAAHELHEQLHEDLVEIADEGLVHHIEGLSFGGVARLVYMTSTGRQGETGESSPHDQDADADQVEAGPELGVDLGETWASLRQECRWQVVIASVQGVGAPNVYAQKLRRALCPPPEALRRAVEQREDLKSLVRSLSPPPPLGTPTARMPLFGQQLHGAPVEALASVNTRRPELPPLGLPPSPPQGKADPNRPPSPPGYHHKLTKNLQWSIPILDVDAMSTPSTPGRRLTPRDIDMGARTPLKSPRTPRMEKDLETLGNAEKGLKMQYRLDY